MVNYESLNKMCNWEREKAMFIIKIAQNLGMDTEADGELGVNPNSGYTYLWLEDYSFSLYMPINCELQKSEIYALWSCGNCGTEEEYNLKEEDSLNDIEREINNLYEEHIKEKEECKN